MKVAIIPVDIEQPIEFKEIEGTLQDFQKIVGGYIEAVRLRDNEVSVALDYYCNEDFYSLEDENNPRNGRASMLYELSFRYPGHIMGPVVCVGGVDDHGNTVGLSEAQVTHLTVFGEMYH
jgi:hypothetical protein